METKKIIFLTCPDCDEKIVAIKNMPPGKTLEELLPIKNETNTEKTDIKCPACAERQAAEEFSKGSESEENPATEEPGE